MPDTKHASLDGRLVIIGFGSIGQGVLPLILRHIDIAPENITIVTAEPRGKSVAGISDYPHRSSCLPGNFSASKALASPLDREQIR